MSADDHLGVQFSMPMSAVGKMQSEYGEDEYGHPILMSHVAAMTSTQMASTRYEPHELDELADDVRERGVEKPIRIGEGHKPGDIGVWDGHNRYWAAAHAGLTHIPATFETEQDRKNAFTKFGLERADGR